MFQLSENWSGHWSRECKSRPCSMPNGGRRHKQLSHSDFSKNEASDATTAVATDITQGQLTVVRTKLLNGIHSLRVLTTCGKGHSTSFMNKSTISTLHLPQNLFVASRNPRITRYQDENCKESGFSTREVSTIDNTALFEKLKLRDQSVDLQGFKDRYPQLMNLSNHS